MREIEVKRVGPQRTEVLFDKVYALPDNDIDKAIEECRCLVVPGHEIVDGSDCVLIVKFHHAPAILDRDIFVKESGIPYPSAHVLECINHELGDVEGRLYLIFDTAAEAVTYKLSN